MSDRIYYPENQCHGKVRHTDRRAARRARNDTRGGGHLRIYQCPHCHYFHLGHPRPDGPDELLEERIALLAGHWGTSIQEARARLARELAGQ